MSADTDRDAWQTARFSRLLLTGAAGGVGRQLRGRLASFAERVRVADLAAAMEAAGPAAAHEEVLGCDLADRAAVDAMVAGCEAIIHLGGVSVERPFEEILEANIKGVFHIYEAARRHGVKRVIFASSNHVTGFYGQDERIDAHDMKRPDGYYGLSKSYGEDMAQFYFDRYGVETVSIRIGSIFPEATNRRSSLAWVTPSSTACRPTPRPGGTTATPRTWAMRPRTVRKSSAPRWKRNRSRPPMIRWRPCKVAPLRLPDPLIRWRTNLIYPQRFLVSSRQSVVVHRRSSLHFPRATPFFSARHGSTARNSLT